MKITEVRLGMISVPLRVPFKTALRSVNSVEDVVVEIHTDTGAYRAASREQKRHNKRHCRKKFFLNTHLTNMFLSKFFVRKKAAAIIAAAVFLHT